MNKLGKLLMGTAILALGACSSDEPANNPENSGNGPAKGDVAYLAINIISPDNMPGSRAGEDGETTEPTGPWTNGEYEFGTGDENEVKTAHFYFYDENYKFVATTNNWVGDAAGEAPNIEKKGKATLMLSGLTGKSYPKYVVTVLNQQNPTSFTAPETLEEWTTKLTDWNSTWTETVNGGKKTRFVMTTSSYFNGSRNNQNGVYFATELTADNFLQETPDKVDFTEAQRVQIYVERLAARVNVGIGSKLTAVSGKTYNDGTNTYPLYETDLTVGGETNDEAVTKLYVWFGGWELNATSKTSRASKSLEGWTESTNFDSWNINHKEYFRSYWGKSVGYGKSDAQLTALLNHGQHTWLGLAAQLGDNNGKASANVYCNECTNEIANIKGTGDFAVPSKTTTVLVKAGVCTIDAAGNVAPAELVEFRGVTYLKERFLDYVFSVLNPQYFTRTEKETIGETVIYEYFQITPADVELVSAGNGTGSVNIAVKAANTKVFYTLGKETSVTKENEDGTIVEVKYYPSTEVSVATINATFKNIHASGSDAAAYKAIAYTKGAMYYPIAIKHLNYKSADNQKVLREGAFGVVRNHAYNITINGIKTLGEGVFKPGTLTEEGEKIDPEDPKDPTYYVESTINILSWKLVNQEEEL